MCAHTHHTHTWMWKYMSLHSLLMRLWNIWESFQQMHGKVSCVYTMCFVCYHGWALLKPDINGQRKQFYKNCECVVIRVFRGETAHNTLTTRETPVIHKAGRRDYGCVSMLPWRRRGQGEVSWPGTNSLNNSKVFCFRGYSWLSGPTLVLIAVGL